MSNINHGTENVATVSAPHKPSEVSEAPAPQTASERARGVHNSFDRSVYVDVARALLPRWLRILGPAPWLDGGTRRGRGSPVSALRLHNQQAAAHAVAILCEADERLPDRPALSEFVRASLIQWQLCLDSDGCPAGRWLRRSPFHGATVGYIIQLLSETAGHQTAMLLADVERHLLWLERRPPQTPWLEASVICALADGAVLVRDCGMLERARRRLDALLARQDLEGWFPELGGADVGRLSLTIDALARLYRQNGWGELEEPLRRALGFLVHFVHPDGRAGGCYCSCDTAFITPYGMELLAPTFPNAAALARFCRRQCATLLPGLLYGSDDHVCAAVGASVSMAAVTAATRLPDGCAYPHQQPGQVRFPRAGLSIFVTKSYHAVVAGRKAGALHVTWLNGAPALEDAGVVVVYSHGTRSGARPDVWAEEHVRGSTVTCRGILRRVGTDPNRLRRWIRSWLSWISRRTRERKPSPEGHRASRVVGSRLTHDRYTRRLTFAGDWISIQDHVRCRFPCEAIVCQSPGPVSGTSFSGAWRPGRAPILLDGGRNVGITRIYRGGELSDQHPCHCEADPILPPKD